MAMELQITKTSYMGLFNSAMIPTSGSELLYPPGIEKPAANVTLAMSVATTIRTSARLFSVSKFGGSIFVRKLVCKIALSLLLGALAETKIVRVKLW